MANAYVCNAAVVTIVTTYFVCLDNGRVQWGLGTIY
jgi:hypothetical protein